MAAGAFSAVPLRPGECARVFTGAPLPEGADCVIRQEHTTRLSDHETRIDDPSDVGRNVRRRGEDISRGALLLEAGTPLGPAQIGVLASIAMAHVSVVRQPRVAVLATGDELADLADREAILGGHRIASSNTYTMLAMSRDAGAAPLNLGIARDDPADLRHRLGQAVAADLVVTSGGMSVGEHDYLRAMLEEAGGTMRFWRLRMRPGAPVGFGILHGKPWIGLPGNPVSTMVTFELFVRPAIRKLAGHRTPFRRAVTVRLDEPIVTAAGLQHFLRVRLSRTGETPTARLTGPQGSGILSSMAQADGLLIVPEGRTEIPAGELLPALPLRETVHVEEPPF